MQLEEQIYLALAGGSPQTDAGSRVYPLAAAQGVETPRITYQRVSTAPENTLGGRSNLDQVRIQVDCWATSTKGAADLARQARDIMEAQSFKALLQGAFDTYEQDTQLYRRSMDFRCWECL